MLQVKCSIQRLEHNYFSTDSICRGYGRPAQTTGLLILHTLAPRWSYRVFCVFCFVFCFLVLGHFWERNGGWINVYTRATWLSMENQMWTLHLKSTLQRWSVKLRQGSFSWEKQPWPLSRCTFPHEVRRLWEILPQGAADWLCFSSFTIICTNCFSFGTLGWKELRFFSQLKLSIQYRGTSPFLSLAGCKGDTGAASEAWLAGHRGQSDNPGPTLTAIPARDHNESPFFLSHCRCEPFSGVLHPQLHHHQPTLHRGNGEPGIWDIHQHGENLESPGESPSKTLSPIPTFVLPSSLAHLLISLSFIPSSNHCSRTAVLGPSILAADWPCSGEKFRVGNVGGWPWAGPWRYAPTILRRADHQFPLWLTLFPWS